MKGGTPGPCIPGVATQAELCKHLRPAGHSWAQNQGLKTVTCLGRPKQAEVMEDAKQRRFTSRGLGPAQALLAPWGPVGRPGPTLRSQCLRWAGPSGSPWPPCSSIELGAFVCQARSLAS